MRPFQAITIRISQKLDDCEYDVMLKQAGSVRDY